MTNIKEKVTTRALKTTLFSALILTLMVPLSGINVVDATNENASPKMPDTRSEIPSAPDVLGCYYYPNEITGWINVPCRTEEEMRDIARPVIGGSSGVHGVRDSASATQSYGLVDVQFSTFSGETDSVTGTSAWSIQTNTNQWQIGGTGNWYIVQFTEQNDPANSINRVACVWQINVSTQTYTPTCIAVPTQTLSSTYHGSVEGKVLTNGNLQTQYCNIGGNTQCWVVTAADTNQLGNYWRDTSGTILGLGSSSSANFVSPTSVTTQVKTGPATAATTLTDYSTAEQNNLNYGTSNTSCAFSICTRTSVATN